MRDRQNPKVATFQHTSLAHVPIKNKWVQQLRRLLSARDFIERRPGVIRKVGVK